MTATPDVPPHLATFLEAFSTLSDAAGRLQASPGGGEPLVPVLEAHLGTDPRLLPVLTEDVSPLRATDADVGLAHVMAAHGGGRTIGIGGGEQRWHTSLSEIVQHAGSYGQFPVGPVDYRTVPVGPDAERSTVAFGVHLFAHDGAPVAVAQRAGNPQFGGAPRLEVLAADGAVAEALLAEVREAMTAHSVLRGQVVTFSASDYDPSAGGVTFHRRPTVGAADIVLPAGTLDRIERHVLGIGRRATELRAAGQHLKRGALLYGPPGTGKTLTVRHLVGAAQGSTVILLSGGSLRFISLAADVARAMQPALVVLEDVDLVAHERESPYSSPLLFEVLDALEGLAPDADVAFLLTTNRADVLEPALAQRPGRVDLAVEIPLPDAPARRALLDLYATGNGFSDEVLAEVAEGTGGITASFVKELVRRAVLLAAEQADPGASVAVGDDHLRAAWTEMTDDGDRLGRALVAGPAWAHPGDDDEPGGGSGWRPYRGGPPEGVDVQFDASPEVP